MDYNKDSIGAIFGIVLGLLITIYYGLTLVYPDLGRTHPERTILESVKGTVEWVKATGKDEDTIRFKFQEFDKYFVYHSTGRMTWFVKEKLDVPNSNIEILVDMSDSHSPPLDDHSYNSVYEVKSNNEFVRSYEQVKNSYMSDFKAVLWIGLGFFVLSVLALLKEIYNQRKQKT
jgi:hypothetical protein